ncbi:hypothetical protein BFS06_14220 [Clostridium perfringens]|uniref:Putative cysteine protease n=1 Tax=Clostridium perfringens TaxID=1502 RepID=A0A140GRG8_CLOPF|nr:transglutaminase domain-containing protein [Clostridium perfringens]AMN31127.1 putative cysteine protease [Clostridium perfringens]TBX14361.1 hypothetical protein BFS06_14220 [Clostridium perfringens]
MKKNTKDLIKLLNLISKEHFLFLKENSYTFPGCCTDSAILISSYLKALGYNVKTCLGYKKLFPNGKSFHRWTEVYIDESLYIIDFTLFQFYIQKNNKFKSFKTQNELNIVYDYCINEIQHGKVLFDQDYYYNIFKFDKYEDLEGLSHMVGCSNYSTFLEALKPNFDDLLNNLLKSIKKDV